MGYTKKPGEHRTLIFYNGQQVGFIASNLDKTDWFAIEITGDKGRVTPGFYESEEDAFQAFKKYHRTSRNEHR